MIRAENISKSYNHRPVLQELELETEQGCTLLLGENGAGKTTLLRILAGLTRPDSGHVWISGFLFSDWPEQARKRIGFFSHHTMLYEDLNPIQNLLFFSRLYRIKNPETRIHGLLHRAGLAGRAGEPVRNLSHGMQQRLALLRAVLHDPDVLLLDEPTRGLDEKALVFLNELLEESIHAGKAILLATHQQASLTCPVNRVLRLLNGSLVEPGTHSAHEPACSTVSGEAS